MRALAVVVVAACGSVPPANGMHPGGAERASALVAARPYRMHVPPGYDAARATPLVILLHGYTDEPEETDAFFRMHEVADREGFLLALPAGTRDRGGNRFWSATDACCDLGGTGVDDVAYLTAVLDDIEARYHVDRDRVYLVGHSNGAFMALRLACELAPRIAAVAAHAGAAWLDPARCKPAAPVSVLAIHGDADSVVRYEGGVFDQAMLEGFAAHHHIRLPTPLVPARRAYPSVHQTVAMWAAIDGCTGPLHEVGRLDLDTSLPGAETVEEAYSGCRDTAVELWTMHGADHMPALARAPAPPAFADAIWAFLRAHPRIRDSG